MRAIRMGVIRRVGLVGMMALAVVAAPAWPQEAGEPVTVTGRVVDLVCLLPMGLKGEMHRECASGCDKAGVRMALLDEEANILYTVMADAPFKDPNRPIREHFERIVTVKGKLYVAPGGQRVLAIEKVTKAPSGG
ncbi:MAG: hypothetical protein ACE5NC_10265 [Anaerolineae bacterium]